MTVQEAIMGFSQSEKVKAGIIWISQAIEMTHGMSEMEKPGAYRVIKTFLDMVAHDAHIAKRVSNDDSWAEAQKHLDKAIVMINSNIFTEVTFHLTNALSQITTIGHRTLQLLNDEGVISI